MFLFVVKKKMRSHEKIYGESINMNNKTKVRNNEYRNKTSTFSKETEKPQTHCKVIRFAQFNVCIKEVHYIVTLSPNV